MHPFLIAAQFVVIQVIDDDVVRTCFPVSQTTWRLSASASQEFHPVGRLELPILPGGIPLLLAEVGNDALVMFQFCLNIPRSAPTAFAGNRESVLGTDEMSYESTNPDKVIWGQYPHRLSIWDFAMGLHERSGTGPDKVPAIGYDRPGLAVGFTGGLLAANGNAVLAKYVFANESLGGFSKFISNFAFVGENGGNTVSGFLGGIAAGFVAGFIVINIPIRKIPTSG